MRIGISAGHSRRCDDWREWSRCKEVCDVAFNMLKACGHEVVAPYTATYERFESVALTNKQSLFNRSNVDLAIELHLARNKGPAVYYWDDPDKDMSSDGSRRWAEAVARGLDFLPWEHGGAIGSGSSNRNDLHFLEMVTAPAIVVEPASDDIEEQADWISSEDFVFDYALLVVKAVLAEELRERMVA